MIDLNNLEKIRKLDPKNVFGSTEMLADQCGQIWSDAKNLNFSNDYKNVQNIVVCGMGGSAYGGHVVLSLSKDELKIPLYVNNDYHLPESADQNSLIILTSYSGSTEETLSCAKEAIEKKSKVTGLTSNGALAEFLRSNNFPSLIFNPQYNPSSQPRLGTGYIVLGTIAILNKIGFISISEESISSAIEELKNSQEAIKTRAKDLAQKIQGFIPIIFAAEFLEGNAHILRNQFNETSKSFSAFSTLPELNHHLMEGLKNPQDKKLITLFITSDLYSDIIKKRVELTKDVVEKNGIEVLEYSAQGSDKLSHVLNTLSFGSYLTLYLSLLYGQDPSLIPWVDYFKEKMKK